MADLRFAWQSRQASGDIVVIAIDASSIDRVGVWPWPRLLHAELIRQLQKADVQDIALDVDFSTPSDASSDRNFAEALQSAGGSVVLPSFQQPRTDRTTLHVNRPLQQFAEHSWPALVNVEVGSDGLVRRYPFGEKLDGKFVPAMAAVLAGQYDEKRTPFLIDFSIRTAGIPKVSFVDVLRGDPATLQKLQGKKVIIGGTALELGDRFSVPNGVIVSGPVLQTLAAESLLQNRALQWTSPVVTLTGLALLALLMLFSWRRLSAGKRVALLAATAVAVEAGAFALQAAFPLILDTSLFQIAIIVYIAAIALDEIDIRDLLGRVAESRFQRVAMSLGDGLICTDSNYLITVWNPGATAIFGYLPEEMIGRPFDEICARDADTPAFSVKNAAELAAGTVIEFDGRRSNGEVFPVEASFSGWQGTDGFQFGAILRDISVRKREAERIRYLAEHDTLTGLINRNTLHAKLEAKIARAEADGRRGRAAGRRHRRLPADQRHARSCQWRSRASRHFGAADGGDAGDGSGRALERRRIRHRSSDERHRRKRQPFCRADRCRLRRTAARRHAPPPRQGQHRRRRVPVRRPHRGRTAEQLPHGAKPRQGDPARRSRAVRGLDPPRTGNAPDAGSRAGAGRGAQ